MNEEQGQLKTPEAAPNAALTTKQKGAAEAVHGTSKADTAIEQYKKALITALDCEYLEFLYSQSMGSWKKWGWASYLAGKLGLTEQQQLATRDEVIQEFGRSVTDPWEWHIFLHGTPEQKEILQYGILCEIEAGWREFHEPFENPEEDDRDL